MWHSLSLDDKMKVLKVLVCITSPCLKFRILIFACHIKIGPIALSIATDEFVFVIFCADVGGGCVHLIFIFSGAEIGPLLML